MTSFQYQFNTGFILKSNLTTAKDYIMSDLFKKFYPNAKKFRFIINYSYQDKEKAGALLLSKFLKETLKNIPNGGKIDSTKVMMFVNDQNQTMQLCQQNGLTMDEMPNFIKMNGDQQECQRAVQFAL